MIDTCPECGGIAILLWSMAHEARTDWSLLLGSGFLLIVGAGPWSMDARIGKGTNSANRSAK